MKRTTKKSGEQPNLIDRLGDSFVKAFEADFQVHGVRVIEQLREKAPDKYVEIGAKLIAAAEQPPSPGDYSRCKSVEDIGRLLLMQVDVLERCHRDSVVKRSRPLVAALNHRLCGQAHRRGKPTRQADLSSLQGIGRKVVGQPRPCVI
jgi:hypothetical protein